MRLGPALVALLSAGVAVLVLKPAGPAPRFEQVADGLYRQARGRRSGPCASAAATARRRCS